MNEPDKADGEAVTVEELIALREGGLSEEEESALRARIAEDPRAQELLVELAQTDEVLEVARSRPMPSDLAESIERLIAREQARRDAGNDQADGEPSGAQGGDHADDRGHNGPGPEETSSPESP